MPGVKADPRITGYFERAPGAAALFFILLQKCAGFGGANYVVQPSGIALGSPKPYAYAWLPATGAASAPYLVLTLRLNRRIPSDRFVQIIEVYPGRYAHHLKLTDPAQLDGEVIRWLREAEALSHEK